MGSTDLGFFHLETPLVDQEPMEIELTNFSLGSWLKEQLKSPIHFSYRRRPRESRWQAYTGLVFDLGDISLQEICFSEARQNLTSIRRSKRPSMFVSHGHQANETDILCAKSEHNNYGHREEDRCWRCSTSNYCDIYGESAIRHIEKHPGSLISHMSLLSNCMS